MNLHEVSRKVGLSRRRACQIEAQALEKCRCWAEERGLRLEDLLS